MSEPGDLFEEVFNLLTAERLLRDPRANGEGVRVALLDSGIDRDRLKEKYRSRGIEIRSIRGAVFREDVHPPEDDPGPPSSPHGTTVADILLSLAPRAELYSANVFGPMGSCEVKVLIRALRWAMDVWRVKVVNLSLGIAEAQLTQIPRRLELLRTIEEAYYRDVVVVAAAHNDHPITRSYPALFAPPLLSVDKGDFADPYDFAYQLREQVEFQARGRGNLGPFAGELATSWAAPHLAGIVTRLLTLRPELKPFEVKTLLYWMDRSGKKRR